jgi:hypothetical protein
MTPTLARGIRDRVLEILAAQERRAYGSARTGKARSCYPPSDGIGPFWCDLSDGRLKTSLTGPENAFSLD